MIIAFDIGNTNIFIGCVSDGEIIFMDRLSTVKTKSTLEYAVDLKNVLEIYGIDKGKIEGGIISSVVPCITATVRAAAEKVIEKPTLIVGPGVKTGVNILTDNPAQVGSDRIAAAAAAIAEYRAPLVIVDMGTATAVSVVDANKNYIGGMIMPGMILSLESLAAQASQLPHIGLEPPKDLIGKNTVECMKSGAVYGSAACIDGIIARVRAKLGQEVTAVLTGGLAAAVAPYCNEPVSCDNELTLKGLYRIYRKNN